MHTRHSNAASDTGVTSSVEGWVPGAVVAWIGSSDKSFSVGGTVSNTVGTTAVESCIEGMVVA